MHIEFVRVHRALHHGLAQAIGGGDEDRIAEAGFGIQGEEHAGGAGFGAHHALHASGQGDQLVVEALVHAVGDGAIIEERGEDFLGRANDVVDTADVEEGFLLAGEGGIRQVFGGRRRAYGDRQIGVALGNPGEGLADLRIQTLRERRVHDPLANLRASLGQGDDVIDIQGIEGGVDALVQAALLEEIAVGLGRGGEPAWNGHARASQVGDHLAEGCVLAAHALDVVHAKLLQ